MCDEARVITAFTEFADSVSDRIAEKTSNYLAKRLREERLDEREERFNKRERSDEDGYYASQNRKLLGKKSKISPRKINVL